MALNAARTSRGSVVNVCAVGEIALRECREAMATATTTPYIKSAAAVRGFIIPVRIIQHRPCDITRVCDISDVGVVKNIVTSDFYRIACRCRIVATMWIVASIAIIFWVWGAKRICFCLWRVDVLEFCKPINTTCTEHPHTIIFVSKVRLIHIVCKMTGLT